jgi:hypothetical protein
MPYQRCFSFSFRIYKNKNTFVNYNFTCLTWQTTSSRNSSFGKAFSNKWILQTENWTVLNDTRRSSYHRTKPHQVPVQVLWSAFLGSGDIPAPFFFFFFFIPEKYISHTIAANSAMRLNVGRGSQSSNYIQGQNDRQTKMTYTMQGIIDGSENNN